MWPQRVFKLKGCAGQAWRLRWCKPRQCWDISTETSDGNPAPGHRQPDGQTHTLLWNTCTYETSCYALPSRIRWKKKHLWKAQWQICTYVQMVFTSSMVLQLLNSKIRMRKFRSNQIKYLLLVGLLPYSICSYQAWAGGLVLLCCGLFLWKAGSEKKKKIYETHEYLYCLNLTTIC